MRRWSRRNKYGSIPTAVDGITFHSKKEALRYKELRLLERAGSIRDLSLQVKIPIQINAVKVCDYVCDFMYFENNTRVIEDVKGWRTHVYILKRKLIKALYNIDIRET